ncbi:MAG: NAD(P)-binding domain-containing protein, partial [Alistipes putredinis]
MKNIVLIGSGNLAEALARAISRTEGATLLQIFARNAKRGTALALENGTAWSSDPRELAAADLYLLAVSDAAITTLAESLPIPAEAAVVHTAGGIGIEALPARFDRRGVLYPLQTFTQGRSVDFAKIPLFVEGNDDTFTSELEAFARNLRRTVSRADSDRRVRL